MYTLSHDLRYALRQLRGTPGFALTVTITLALGIGANTAIFTLVHGILLRSLPVGDPAQLYRIGDTDDCCIEGGFPGNADSTGDFSIFSYDLYQYIKTNTPEFKQLAAAQAGSGQMAVRRGDGLPKTLFGEFVSGNYFSTLGLSASSGRVFNDSDDTRSAPPAVVLNYQSWQSEYAGDPGIVGSTIYIQAKPFTVAGIAPRGFFGDRVTDRAPDFWLPLNAQLLINGNDAVITHPDSHWLYPIGRVRPGVSIPALQSKITGELHQWLYTRPTMIENGGNTIIPKMRVQLSPAGGGIQNLQLQTGKGLKLLMILSVIVLLIACANIANLMLARATSHRSEIAVRVALGAVRGRILRQVLTESILLSFIGGVAGIAVAYAAVRGILVLAFPDARYLPVEATPSPTVLLFAFLVALLTGILFGAGPAWLSSHAQPAEALRGVNRSTRDRSSLPQKTLVVFQAALSIVLLVAAILMTKSLARLQNQDFGVVTANRYVVHFDPKGAGYTQERLPGLYREIQNRFSSLPGVTSMSLAMYSPLEGDNWGECVIQQGHAAPRAGEECGSTWVRVSTHYLESIGVPIVRGRDFSDQDTANSLPVAMVNETFAKKFFPKQDPIGQRFGINRVQYSGSFQIVGVFRDFKMNNPQEKVRPVFLRPLPQFFAGYKEPDFLATENFSMNMNALILAFNRPPADVDSLVRNTLAGIDPNLAVIDLRTFGDQVAGNFIQDRLIARLASLFGVLALLLASVGLYGVMSYFVARRTSEIGIRMALGATQQSVIAMVMRGALWQILIGLIFGIPASLYAGYLMKVMLYGVDNYDPMAILGAPLVLVVFALSAAFVPARRAASIEPVLALRSE